MWIAFTSLAIRLRAEMERLKVPVNDEWEAGLIGPISFPHHCPKSSVVMKSTFKFRNLAASCSEFTV